ncbi:MAG TPA: GrlR family regulatory protein [Bosea sp. (in: a-proteobacteria)]|jgi:hypothetical protein|uniref:GrlR family regulatory protein n=1 Tax=Bosea sp. (in: a-proteobacteria) TaxID=1871050 RepID=UPI002DDDB529|nr:GrlR family regulatory protein [Bosea sp. (in: a-proteobacteria)]HEV2556856.1 GrlR family regulatory protein [Bosea sp. (in: a-proteobacteria)]
MPIQAGTYKAEFETQRGAGCGVVVIEAGRIRGGDSAMFYVGTYREEGDAVSAKVQVGRHSVMPTIENVFGLDNIEVDFSGSVVSGSLSLRGTSKVVPGIEMRAVLTRISD